MFFGECSPSTFNNLRITVNKIRSLAVIPRFAPERLLWNRQLDLSTTLLEAKLDDLLGQYMVVDIHPAPLLFGSFPERGRDEYVLLPRCTPRDGFLFQSSTG
jgi:hypothetical protein